MRIITILLALLQIVPRIAETSSPVRVLITVVGLAAGVVAGMGGHEREREHGGAAATAGPTAAHGPWCASRVRSAQSASGKQ